MDLDVLQQEPQSSGKFLWWALAFSVLMHVLFFIGFPTKFYAMDQPITSRPERIIHVQHLKSKDEGQIVDIEDKRHETDQNVDTNYLSDRNRMVEKQTRSMNITRQQNQSTNTNSQEQTVEKKSKYSLNLSDRAILDLTEKNSGKIAMSQSLTSNYLPEITIGDETLLNTKGFAFNAFYIRMKRDIEGFWRPSHILTQNPSLHGIYVTTLTVILDQEGYLVQDPILLKSSGVTGLDAEAIGAIVHASPFLNPPAELFQGEEQLRMNWSFIFNSTMMF